MSYKFLIKLKVFLYTNYPKKEIDIIYEKNIIVYKIKGYLYIEFY